MTVLTTYQYRGARALVLLHQSHLREFLETWRFFKSSGAALPETSDPDYASTNALLRHVLGSARSYMLWICEKLALPKPDLDPPPDETRIVAEAPRYIEQVLDKWRAFLVGVSEELFSDQTFVSRWGVLFSVESMLEHAVLHPMRHTFQLREILDGEDLTAEIIRLERGALDRWARGDPSGFLELSSADVVYFDPFLECRLDGFEALKNYYESLRGKVKIDRYELINPRVELCGDAAVLTFNYVSCLGETKSRWNCTEVYRREASDWRIIQTHWSATNASQ